MFARHGIFLGLYLIILLIVIMGGRVIPFFTERALPGVVIKRWPLIEWLAPLTRDRVYACRAFVPELGTSGSLGRACRHH